MSGMTLWRASIKKTFQGEDWDNVYTLNAASLTAATGAAQQIVVAERSVHTLDVGFVSLTIEPAVLGAGGGTVVALTGNGTHIVGSEYLPLFNVVRCFFRPAAGKPSQKYLRLPVQESIQAAGAITGAFLTTIQTNYVNPLMTIPEFVDVDGQAFVTAGVHPRVGMRQLKRKRRSRPNEKRGWVPK